MDKALVLDTVAIGQTIAAYISFEEADIEVYPYELGQVTVCD